MNKAKSPSINETAFDCPHCGAYTTQFWFEVWGKPKGKNSTPNFPTKESIDHFLNDNNIPDQVKTEVLSRIEKNKLGYVELCKQEKGNYCDYDIDNLHLSKCYNCNKVAVWVYKTLLFPKEKTGTPPNQDLPDDIIHDFNEARAILSESPRGAAALLRLCIQKLCSHLGEKGKNINDDIASLVSKGLNPLVQKSLDIVRVVGNEAVHPGVIDINDEPLAEIILNIF